MIEEVVYTSVKKGLYPGQEGYCIVARSKALSRLIEERLSALSNYRHLEDPAKTPTNYSHLLFQTKTDQYHLFSRVGDGGNDFSERRCFFTHHIAESDFQLLAPAGTA